MTYAGGFGTVTLWLKLATCGVRSADVAQRHDVADLRSLAAVALRELALEVGDPAGELLDRVGDRVGQVHPVGVRALGLAALDPDRVARVADDGRVRRDVVDDHRVGAD